MRNHLHRFTLDGVELDEPRKRCGTLDDYAVRRCRQMFDDPLLRGGGPHKNRVQDGDHGNVHFVDEIQHLRAVLAAVDAELMLKHEHVQGVDCGDCDRARSRRAWDERRDYRG